MGAAVIDGATLRTIRESQRVPLRRVARVGGTSHGHLSKVERCERGRPVTPSIIRAYEHALGLRIDAARIAGARAAQGEQTEEDLPGWHPGQLTPARRLAYLSSVAATAMTGVLGDGLIRTLDRAGVVVPAPRIGAAEVAQLHHLARMLATLDVRFAGRLAGPLAQVVLPWAIRLLNEPPEPLPLDTGLHAAVSRLALRAGWWLIEEDRHDAARELLRLALHAAVLARQPDLRARVLATIAAQHGDVGYRDEALELLRNAEGDERLSPEVATLLKVTRMRIEAPADD